MKNKTIIAYLVTLLCITLFLTPSINANIDKVLIANDSESGENALVTCHTFGLPGESSQKVTLPYYEADCFYNKIKELQIEITRDPLSDRTQRLQHEIITLADEYNLLPTDLSVEKLRSHLIQSKHLENHQITQPCLQKKATETFCTFVSIGVGRNPIIVFPRLIPIILTPIPRLFTLWNIYGGITSCKGLNSGTGFNATGQQKGIALGFCGIGFTVFYPPILNYVLLGYALYVSVDAEHVEFFP